MKINIIGNGSIGAKNFSACTLVDDHVLIDAPNGAVKHLKRLGYDVLKIDLVLITHCHGDHFFDIPFFMFERYYREIAEPLTIICPSGTEQKVRTLFDVGFPGDFEKITEICKINFVEFNKNCELKFDEFDVETVKVEHGSFKNAYGYLLKKGQKAVAFSGDTTYCPAVDYLIVNSDLAILDACQAKTSMYSHMGTDNIKLICKKYPNKTIVATHMKDKALAEFQNSSPKNLIVPEINFEINL